MPLTPSESKEAILFQTTVETFAELLTLMGLVSVFILAGGTIYVLGFIASLVAISIMESVVVRFEGTLRFGACYSILQTYIKQNPGNNISD